MGHRCDKLLCVIRNCHQLCVLTLLGFGWNDGRGKALEAGPVRTRLVQELDLILRVMGVKEWKCRGQEQRLWEYCRPSTRGLALGSP